MGKDAQKLERRTDKKALAQKYKEKLYFGLSELQM
jgi:hypothetical protein